jgi:hypothetical protein
MITYPDGKSTVTATAANTDTPFVFPKGEYDYSVTTVGYKTYRTGTQGIEIELEGVYSSGKTFRCFDRVFLTENAMWKLDQFLSGLGLTKRPENEDELNSLTGRRGRAVMGPNEDGYPKVIKYQEEERAEDWSRVGPPPIQTSEDVPF